MVVTNDADHLLPEFAHQYVSETRQLRLSESYFKQDGSKISGKSNYWSTTNRPLDSQIYSDGARIGADVILMYSYSGRYGSEDRFDVTVYLFDVKNRRAYQSNGDQDNYKRVTESLFREITATTVSSNLPQEGPASGAAAAATALAGETMVKMTGDKIQQILPGNTIVGYDSGMNYSLWYPGGNDVIQTSERGEKTGTWRVKKESDEYCRTYHDGKGERCFELFEKSSDVQNVILIEWRRGGRWSDTSVLVKGDQREKTQEINSEHLL
jgi:hypothetical protein